MLVANRDPIGGETEADFVWIRTTNGLNGDGLACYDWAAMLFQKDSSRQVLLSVPPPNRLVQAGVLPSFKETSLRELSDRGVPASAVITIEGNEHDPWQEGRFLEAWLDERPKARVLLLCNRFAGRFWRRVLDSVLQSEHRDNVAVWALPDPLCDETNWWRTRSGFKNVFNSYVSLLYAWCRRGDAPQWGWSSPDEYEQAFLSTTERSE